jgi:hypothetical protein
MRPARSGRSPPAVRQARNRAVSRRATPPVRAACAANRSGRRPSRRRAAAAREARPRRAGPTPAVVAGSSVRSSMAPPGRYVRYLLYRIASSYASFSRKKSILSKYLRCRPGAGECVTKPRRSADALADYADANPPYDTALVHPERASLPQSANSIACAVAHLHHGLINGEACAQLHPVVDPQVSHLRHVPLRSSVKLPHSSQASPS